MKKILALETSCDDTAAAIVDEAGGVLAEAVFSQTNEHKAYGGIVPEIGSRAHIEQILPIVKRVFNESGLVPANIDAIAATFAPGLIGPLLVGAQFAKGMALSLNIPLIAVHHIEGHIFSGLGDKNFPKTPFLALIASGGHTALYGCDEQFSVRLIGETLDDAAGEAFDKIGRALGLPYPSGKLIDDLANLGNKNAYPLPIAMRHEDHFNFSFSGLKTKALMLLKSVGLLSDDKLCDFCASLREAIALALAERAIKAAEEFGFKSIVLGGGVAANSRLRDLLQAMGKEKSLDIYLPKIRYCTDNAVMIAHAAHIRLRQGRFSDFLVDVMPTLPIDQAFLLTGLFPQQ